MDENRASRQSSRLCARHRTLEFLARWRWLLFATIAALQTQSTAATAAEPRRLTTDGRLKFSPVFVSGGKEVVYCVHDKPNRIAIMRLNLKTGKTTRVSPDDSAHRFDPAYSPDGRYHCFARSGGTRQLSLVIVETKTGKQALFHPPGALRSTIRTPRFTRDGKRIVFTLNAPGGQQIASVDLKGQNLKKLTQSAGINGWPDISPDGKKIAFSSSRDGALDIFTMDSDGNNVRRLTRSRFRDIRPAWSPDGKRIAFTSARDGNYEIYIMNANGSAVKRITRHSERDDYPVWHPDGKRLLWIAERKGRFDLFLMQIGE